MKESEGGMRLAGAKIALLIESDYYEPEIFYYERRLKEEGADLHIMSRLWNQPSLTFTGHEWKVPLVCNRSFEGMTDGQLRGYSAILVPSGMVADRLRYSEDLRVLPPATELLRRAFAEPSIVKGIICHGLMILSVVPDLLRGRRVTAHNNLYGDVKNMGAIYTDRDVVVDCDLVTARAAEQAPAFMRTLIDLLASV